MIKQQVARRPYGWVHRQLSPFPTDEPVHYTSYLWPSKLISPDQSHFLNVDIFTDPNCHFYNRCR